MSRQRRGKRRPKVQSGKPYDKLVCSTRQRIEGEIIFHDLTYKLISATINSHGELKAVYQRSH